MEEEIYECMHGVKHTRKDLEMIFKLSDKDKQGECWFSVLKLWGIVRSVKV